MHEDDGPRERLRRDGDLVRDPRRSIAIAMAMLAGVAVLAIAVASDVDAPPLLQGLDDAWRRTALAWPGWIRSVGEAFERLGAGVVMVPLRIVVAIWLVVRRRRWDLAAWLLGWILADVLTAALKPGLARARPTAMDPENPFTSFPSAHAKTAAQVAIGLVLVASSPWRSRRGWYALAAAWIVLMATSRTVVDHHWLSDVVAGSLLGAGAALLAAAATQLIRDGRARAQMPDPAGETPDLPLRHDGAVFGHLRATYERHRRATMRVGVALLATALGLVVVGGAIRVLRAADRSPRPTVATGSPSAEWRATVDTPVTGLAIDDGRLYVAGDQLTVFPVSCAVTAGRCAPRWRGVVPDGPLSVPTVRDERVFVGSAEGQLYAFPSTCDGEGCSPEWVGVAGDGPVSQPAANFDLVYVTSDELYAFPVGCASEDLACPPAWSADVPGRPAAGPPALGEGLVVVASSSTRGGVAAYPAVCGDDCEPVWTGRTDGPATAVAIGEGLAFSVARGQLMAFSLSCTGRCEPEWRAPFVPGAPFATGATSAPAVTDGRVLVGDDQGRLWVFRSTCDQARCDPLTSYEVATTPLRTPAVDGDRVIVTSDNGAIARVLLDCRSDEACDPVRVRKLAAPALAPAVIAPEATIAGSQDGSVEAFKW